MRIVVAPDSFKESMTSVQACAAMARGIARVIPDAEIDQAPMADGGEGTMSVLSAALGAEPRIAVARSPLGDPINAPYSITSDGCAIIDIASVVGMALVPPTERDVMASATWGVGAVIRAALDDGAERLLIGLGGSATNDGGAGMVVALGARLLDDEGEPVEPTPEGLSRVSTVDLAELDPRLSQTRIEAACDVANPLLGSDGATAVFSPQKGGTAETMPVMEAAITRWAAALSDALGRDCRQAPGAGAAGGLGFALLMLGGVTRSGIDVVISATGLDKRIAAADLVLTGEGSLDSQTASGKAPWGIARVARRHGVPVIAFAGRVLGGEQSYDAVMPIVPGPIDLATAMRDGQTNLEHAVVRALRLVTLAHRDPPGACDDPCLDPTSLAVLLPSIAEADHGDFAATTTIDRLDESEA
ncbi:MAG: glycerate kinase [Propionibacteriaceae bacterium]|jgi:glycerate kinase|nr:glycerate kinase [Propionibacteriaceae bacterium]